MIDNRTYVNIEGRWRDLFNKMKVLHVGCNTFALLVWAQHLGWGKAQDALWMVANQPVLWCAVN